jgi:hypothetical protein
MFVVLSLLVPLPTSKLMVGSSGVLVDVLLLPDAVVLLLPFP